MKKYIWVLVCHVEMGAPKVERVSSEGEKIQQILVTGMSDGFKLSKSKTIHQAILEIAVDAHTLGRVTK